MCAWMSDLVKKIFSLIGVVCEMSQVEWTKQVKLVTEQALKHMKQ
jgi:hypothetical protein